MNAELQVRHVTKLVREGNLAVDVEVRVVENGQGIVEDPCLPLEEAKKLDAVRRTLRKSDIKTRPLGKAHLYA